MNCQACGGACCEDLTLWVKISMGLWHSKTAARMWWRSSEPNPDPDRCIAHGSDGRCTVYSRRPNDCRTYRPGGAACLTTVLKLRTREQYARIREVGDPAHELLGERIVELVEASDLGL